MQQGSNRAAGDKQGACRAVAIAAVAMGALMPPEAHADGFPPVGELARLVLWSVSIPIGAGALMAAALGRVTFVFVGLGGGVLALVASPIGFGLADKYGSSDRVFEALMVLPGLVVAAGVMLVAGFAAQRVNETPDV